MPAPLPAPAPIIKASAQLVTSALTGADVSGSDVARVTPLLSESQPSAVLPPLARGHSWASADQSEARDGAGWTNQRLASHLAPDQACKWPSRNLMKGRNVKSYANVMVQCTLNEH